MATLAGARVARQSDVIEWFTRNRGALEKATSERWKVEKGVLDYLKDGLQFVREMRGRAPAKPEAALDTATVPQPKQSPLEQYNESQELLKKIKWKRVTWDDDADFHAFSRRVIENDGLFGKVPAFSFLTLHLVHDSASSKTADILSRNVRDTVKGSLSNLRLMERVAQRPSAFEAGPATQRPPFTVDWVSGEAHVLDSASPQELITFLDTCAPQLQALQRRIDEENEKMMEDVETMRFRMRATALVFNKNNRSYWDDKDRRGNPDYVSPKDLRRFLESTKLRATLLRRFVRGNNVRVVPSGHGYRIDTDKNEICIPANFDEFNCLSIHGRYEAYERFVNGLRYLRPLWFFMTMMLIGDLEIL